MPEQLTLALTLATLLYLGLLALRGKARPLGPVMHERLPSLAGDRRWWRDRMRRDG